jgi:NCS1 family nucleobase:cation symporter-1
MTAEPRTLSTVENELLKVETAGIEPIPPEDRTTRPWELGGLWAGAFMNYTSLLTGSLLVVFGLGVLDSLGAIVVGAVLAAVVLGLLSVSGPRGGVPQIVFSRSVFGHRGAYLPGILTLFLAVGWFAVDCVIATSALVQLAGEVGIGSSQTLKAAFLLVVVAISVLVAVYGHRTVVVFERFGALVFLAFCLVLLGVLAPKIHWGLSSSLSGSAHLGAWVLGASVTFALVASWFSFAADYARYLPARSPTPPVVGWVAAGSALPMIGLGMLGVLFFSIDTKTGDLLTTIVQNTARPLAVGFLLFVALGMIWANYLDVYTAGLVTLALDVPLRRWQTALLAGVLGGLLAYYALFVSSFYTAYENFLLVTYIWAPAWAAVLLLSLFVFDRDTGYRGASRRDVLWPAVLALVAGTTAAVPFVNSTLWQSPLAVNLLQGADLSGFVSFIVGGAVYAGLRLSKVALPSPLEATAGRAEREDPLGGPGVRGQK